jgi:hypothetical protein
VTAEQVIFVAATAAVVGVVAVGWCICLVRFAMGIVEGVEEASDPARGFTPEMNQTTGPTARDD